MIGGKKLKSKSRGSGCGIEKSKKEELDTKRNDVMMGENYGSHFE